MSVASVPLQDLGAFGAVIAALVGLLFGSFLNVVAHRLPRDLSIVSPPSHCPSCGAAIGARDNVPVLSWILLRGRCRSCKARISVR
jgi:leader peptidase (prepilin peptidase)/N-methyltransferase